MAPSSARKVLWSWSWRMPHLIWKASLMRSTALMDRRNDRGVASAALRKGGCIRGRIHVSPSGLDSPHYEHDLARTDSARC